MSGVPEWAKLPLWPSEADDEAMKLLRPPGDDVLTLWPVRRAVNNVDNTGAGLPDCVDDLTASLQRDPVGCTDL